MLSAPPAAVARLRKAGDDASGVCPARTCAVYAVQRPKAAGPVAFGPTGVADGELVGSSVAVAVAVAPRWRLR